MGQKEENEEGTDVAKPEKQEANICAVKLQNTPGCGITKYHTDL